MAFDHGPVYPEGFSVNDSIDPALCSLSYITVEQVAAKALLGLKKVHFLLR